MNYFISDDDPTNLIRIKNQQVNSSSSRTSTLELRSNIKSVVLKILDNIVASNTKKKTKKRWKVNPHRGIATSEAVFTVVCKKEEKKKQKANVKLLAPQTRKRKSNRSKAVEQEMDKDKDENIDILEDNSELSNETNDCSDSESKRPSL